MAEREDWTSFRTIQGLQQKAGVPASRLRRLVLKELADNGRDAGASIETGMADGKYFVEDDGPGIDGTPEEIAELFSIRRPMRSTKMLRLPQRGALGNGLRVVAGAVLASEGTLVVVTRDRRIVLRPQGDGSSAVVKVSKINHPVGTRIEIGFGPSLPGDGEDPCIWADAAIGGSSYAGKSSPFWYDAPAFHELILAHGAQPLRSLVAQLDGCSGGKAGEIVSAAGLDRMVCQDVDRQQALRLLEMARLQAREVNPARLQAVGRDAFPDRAYATMRGTTPIGSIEPLAEIPCVVEAWAEKITPPGATAKTGDDIKVDVLVNRTPVVVDMAAWRDSDRMLCLRGCGLAHIIDDAPKVGAYDVVVNVTTPYCPITSDGKVPDLQPFAKAIMTVVAMAMRKAQRAAPKDQKVSQKDVILDNLDDAIAAASGDGEYRFNERQVFYQVRPIVLEETGIELQIGNFKAVITDYENEHGEIDKMYRENRGAVYHPHLGEDIALGTLMVEAYERPAWTFDKILYVEKEGFSEALKDNRWPERHDCALMSSKGFTTRAARDLVDKLAEHDEPVTVFCVHDADGPGSLIHQTFQEATKARGARKIKIVNLGLEPWEAIAMGLEIEDVPEGKQRKPVAAYVRDREDRAPDGSTWDDWLQTSRIELNAMTTPQFIAWLDGKLASYGKLIPPEDVVADDLEAVLEEKVSAAVRERILREAGFEDQVAEALEAIKRPSGADLIDGIKSMFERSPTNEWRAHNEAVATELTSALEEGEEDGEAEQ